MRIKERELEELNEQPAFEDLEPTDEELEEMEGEAEKAVLEDESGELPDDLLRLYRQEVGRIPLLADEEVLRLATVIQTGRKAEDALEQLLWNPEALPPEEQEKLEKLADAGERAKNKLTEANLRLVLYGIKKYKGRGVPEDELIQEGNVGLMKAAERFDPTRGAKFSTYAMWWIRQGARRAVSAQNTIRIPDHMVDDLYKVKAVAGRLAQELGREPREEEIAAELSKPVDWVRKMRSYDLSTISLETPVGEDEGAEIGDLIPDEQQDEPVRTAEDNDRRRRLLEVLDTLPIQEKQVICLRYGIDCDALRMDEVAEVLGLTRERVRQIEEKALRSLLRPERKKLLKGLLG